MKKLSILFLMMSVVFLSRAQTTALAGNQDTGSIAGADEVKKETVPVSPSDRFNAYSKGNILLNAGLSVGLIGYSYGYGNASGFLPVTVSGEYSFNDQISFGAYVGIYSRRYNDYYYSGQNHHVSYNIFSVGARASFHATALMNDKLRTNIPDNLDIYGTVILGVQTYSWSSNVNGFQEPSSSGVVFGPAVGARYMFTRQFGVYAEAGRGPFGFLGIGASLKL